MEGKDTEAAFCWIIEILNKQNIPFQIGGGFAARVYGSKRELADIDIALPTDKLSELLPDVKDYITYKLDRYLDENWDVTGMTVEYKGQEIDLVGAQGKRIFDKVNKKWITLENDFPTSEYKEVYGLKVPIMAKEKLIAYKTMLGREVDLIDIKELSGKLKNRVRATAIIKKDKKVLLFHRIKNGHDYFVFPGGGVEEGETVEDALKREVNEELMLEVKDFKPLFVIEDLDIPIWATIHYGQKQDHHYFLIERYTGVPELSGPEKEQMNEQNQYHIVWIDFEDLKNKKNIFPGEGVLNLLSVLKLRD